MLKLTIHNPLSSSVVEIREDGNAIVSPKNVGKTFYDILYKIVSLDIATNDVKKDKDNSLYLIPSQRGTIISNRKYSYVFLPLKSYLKQFNIQYPDKVNSEIIEYEGNLVLRLFTKKNIQITGDFSGSPVDAGKHGNDLTEENLVNSGVPKKLAKDILKHEKKKNTPKKAAAAKTVIPKDKNKSAVTTVKKPDRPAKYVTKSKEQKK